MADEPNPYAAVLADLERERDQINGMIAMIKRRMGLTADDGPVTTAIVSGAPSEPAQIRSDTFFGMTISEAVKKYLAMMKRPQRVTDIAKALDDGGLLHKSGNWIGTVQTTLTRMKGVVVRVPNGWGLLEWYPGRNFDKQPPKPKTKKRRKKKAQKHGEEATETKHPNASRQLQGQYLNLLKKISKDMRSAYKNVAKQEGREKAIAAMKHHLMMEMTKGQ